MEKGVTLVVYIMDSDAEISFHWEETTEWLYVDSHFPGFGVENAKHLASWEWCMELKEIDSVEQPRTKFLRIYEREDREWDR